MTSAADRTSAVDRTSAADRTTGTPRWVKVTGIVVGVVVLLVVVLLLTGHHGPGRHLHVGQPAGPAGAGIAGGPGRG